MCGVEAETICYWFNLINKKQRNTIKLCNDSWTKKPILSYWSANHLAVDILFFNWIFCYLDLLIHSNRIDPNNKIEKK